MKYIISGMVKVSHTAWDFSSFWRRVFNRPVPRQIDKWERATLIVETTKPIFNEVKLLDGGNMVWPQIEQISASQYQAYVQTNGSMTGHNVEAGITNLLLNTQKTHPNP